MPKKKAKREMSPWGKLRIQAGVAKREGKPSEAKKLRAKAARLEAQAEKKSGRKKTRSRKAASAQKGQNMNTAVNHIKAVSRNLGLTPREVVQVFTQGIKATMNKGLGK